MQQRVRSEAHNIKKKEKLTKKTKKINKISLSANDCNRLQMLDGVISYSYGACAGRVCKTELFEKNYNILQTTRLNYTAIFFKLI